MLPFRIFAAIVVGGAVAIAADEPRSMKEILATTPEELAEKLGDDSEAGYDRAAQLWASAKRSETEAKLAEQDVSRVARLDVWRQLLEKWQDASLAVSAFEAGGGTVWGHLAARDDAKLEIFLAKHAQGLTEPEKEEGEAVALDLLSPYLTSLEEGVKYQKEENEKDVSAEAADLRKNLEAVQKELAKMLGLLPGDATRLAVKEWAAGLKK